MQSNVSPLTVAAVKNMNRIREAEARRAKLRKAGVRSPLTRAELAAQAQRVR
jgi:hypothetical protein